MQYCLDKRDDPTLGDPFFQEKAGLRITPQSTGNPDVADYCFLMVSPQHQPHILNKMAPAEFVGRNADLELFGKPLKPAIFREMPVEPTRQGFHLGEADTSLTGAGNAAHRASAGPARGEPQSGQPSFHCAKVVLSDPVKLDTSPRRQMERPSGKLNGYRRYPAGLAG